jgi:hypothetical protein
MQDNGQIGTSIVVSGRLACKPSWRRDPNAHHPPTARSIRVWLCGKMSPTAAWSLSGVKDAPALIGAPLPHDRVD